MSRIPVREALDAEGLIAIVPNRGAIVPALSQDNIEELFSIRALLEPEVLKLSVPRLTEEDFSEASALRREYFSELRREDHVSTSGRLNWQFHSILYSRADQPRFMAIIRNVNNSGQRHTRLQLYLTHGMKPQDSGIVPTARRCRSLQTAAPTYRTRWGVFKAGA